MSGIKEFIQQFGEITFEEHPFCDGDALALSTIIYMPFDKVVSQSFDVEPVDFSEHAGKLFNEMGGRYTKLGLLIPADASKRMMEMSLANRYKDVKLYGMKRVNSHSPAVQFFVGTFILPDGTMVVAFEGTDDTIAGWKEDVDILIRRGSPAYKYALDYIENLAKKRDGDFIILGHSKGGNEALYTALKCSSEVRKRIRGVYNNDGPGYANYDIFHTGSYDEISERYHHYVPSSSLIGMMLAHDDDYIAVKSTKHLGILQHDMGTWKVKDGNVDTVPDTDFISKVSDAFLSEWIRKTPEALYTAMDSVITGIWEGSGQETLTELAKNAGSALKGAAKAWKNIEPATKENFKTVFKGTGKLMVGSIKSVKNGAKKAANKVLTLVTE